MALALFLFWLLCAPVEVYGEWAVPSKLPEIGLRLVLFFLSGALWATVGLLFSGLTQNVYLAYASPFILYYVLIILQERYFRDAFMLNPQNYLTMHGAWPLQGKSAALTLLSLVILFQLLFFLTAQNELRDDKRQRRAFSSLAAGEPFPPSPPGRLVSRSGISGPGRASGPSGSSGRCWPWCATTSACGGGTCAST